MFARKILAVAVALPLLTGPVLAQVASDKDENAHHYEGGPKTVVPHMMNYPRQKNVGPQPHHVTSHHYSGGPQNPSHHMGDKHE
jgi:hypothetical protein